ncbi:NRAMP (natural resistance-associated macrophage protein) metal ion transporters [Aquiflexum balticum DSM 16537]|uniref:NRAMP (Natural resistance-associated macrophage protein) metal ion transporters n=1 Tax=Aquiflexum balticum DSM 16537 TaxID=758820 RepID=A0A1W2H8U7_9BACT|nr:Nramp family divalent metal transporter [Aquiflexum balticum]SMD45132.1 NRAMP (natural resistance-associated macrophage protein) metal ion transporters [Aquiflexum balticum DSM 16537]
MKSDWKKYIGPGPLIAAAFIGPGTVTVCTLAGVKFGYDLLWALGLSIIATIVLQEMSARIGLITQKGLAAVISQTLKKGLLRYFSLFLILLAIVLGNAAYEAGNITGGAMGADLLVNLPVLTLGQLELNLLNLSIGLIALILLMSGSYSKIAGFLTLLVIMMSLAFLASAIWVQPSVISIFEGFIPKIDATNILTIVALIGTTVVPYNLFLHSSLVAKRWTKMEDLKYVRVDTMVAVVLGGLVSMAIIITSASGAAMDVNNAADLAIGLEPIMGVAAKYFIAFGLFAAGITSAITAPLAGSLVVVDCFGWSNDIRKMPMRISIIFILGLGLFFSSMGIKPVQLITFAQLANGILLPLLSAYILWLVNKKSVMKSHQNNLWLNVLGTGIWLITFLLGGMSVSKVMGWI